MRPEPDHRRRPNRFYFYFLENYREALDAPGEWFLDRGGLLS